MFVCLFLFYVLVFCSWSLWDLTSPTRDPTHTCYTRKWSLNHWTAREVLRLGLERWDSEGFIMSKKHISSRSWENKICLSAPVITAPFWKCLLQKAPEFLKCFSVHKAPSKPAQKVERSSIICSMLRQGKISSERWGDVLRFLWSGIVQSSEELTHLTSDPAHPCQSASPGVSQVHCEMHA